MQAQKINQTLLAKLSENPPGRNAALFEAAPGHQDSFRQTLQQQISGQQMREESRPANTTQAQKAASSAPAEKPEATTEAKPEAKPDAEAAKPEEAQDAPAKANADEYDHAQKTKLSRKAYLPSQASANALEKSKVKTMTTDMSQFNKLPADTAADATSGDPAPDVTDATATDTAATNTDTPADTSLAVPALPTSLPISTPVTTAAKSDENPVAVAAEPTGHSVETGRSTAQPVAAATDTVSVKAELPAAASDKAVAASVGEGAQLARDGLLQQAGGKGHAQFIEHLTQSLTLRERLETTPAPNSYAAVAAAQAAQQVAQAPLAAAPGSSNQINVYPGRPGWDQAIAQKLTWMVGAAEQSATLTLNPPDLGPLQVVIHVHNDQADTTFISDHADVRQALQDGLANLRDMMQASGINLGQANINAGSQQSFNQAATQAATPVTAGRSQEGDGDTAAPQPGARQVALGLVDTFA